MPQALRLLATFDFKPGSWDQVAPVVRECIAQTRKEAGNIFYAAHFEQANPNRIVFIEHWASQEAIDIHIQTTHFKNLMKTAQPLLERPLELLTLTEI